LKVDEAWLARVRDLFGVVMGVPYPWFYRRGVWPRYPHAVDSEKMADGMGLASKSLTKT
jgi:hypothetical protein